MRKAFSLMELMIVILILGLLTAVILPNLVGKSNQAKEKLVCIQMKSLANALDTFKIELGTYPTMEEGLMALVQNPNEDEYKNYPKGGYINSKKAPLDSWGHEYIYVLEDNAFDIISLGADGKEGGEDENKDIKLTSCE